MCIFVLTNGASYQMNITVITTFTDSLLRAKFIPLGNLNIIDNIYIICDNKGTKIPKVTYITPPNWMYSLLHKSFAKLITLFFWQLKTKSTIISAYNVFPHGINAWVISKIFNKPVFQHLPGSYAEITVRKELSDNSLVKRFPKISKFVERLNKYVLKKSDYIFVPGSNTVTFINRNLKINSKRILKIHDAVDIKIFNPNNCKKEYDIILVATFREVKRIDIFIKVIKLIMDKFPKIKACIVGDGPLKDKLMKLSAELGIKDNIEFTGFIKNPVNFYRKSKVFLLTSITEGISVAAMEAMSCGVPVVCSDVGDMSDIVKNGHTGYIVNNNCDLTEYYNKVIKVLNNEELLKKMSTKSIKIIQDNHSYLSAEKFWENFFSKLNF